jgi:TetR/AcrR family transcriptional regulator, cholesterol catabolism regulator
LSSETESSGVNYVSKEERIKQIVKTSAGLFIEKGYYETTTRQIAEACGITSGTLYHYIKSKDDLLAMFADLLSAEFGKFNQKIRRDLGKVSPETALRNTVSGFVLLIDDIQDMVLFWYEESKNLDRVHLKRMIDVDLEITSLFKDIIDLGRKEGRFKVKDSLIAAYSISLMCDMWALKRWYLSDLYSVDKFAVQCADIAVSIARGHDQQSLK